MALPDSLKQQDLAKITSGVAKLLPFKTRDQSQFDQESLEIGESFPIWSLTGNQLPKELNWLDQVKNTNLWHCQIKISGSIETAARCYYADEGGGEKWIIREFVDGQMAEQLDKEFGWLHSRYKVLPRIRLLEIPAYGTTLFWLLDKDEQDRFAVAYRLSKHSTLENRTVYTVEDLFETLSKQNQIVGVKFKSEKQ